MDIRAVFTATSLLLVLGALFSTLIVYISKKLSIEHDIKIDQIRELLSGANCGGCGYAGCDAYAKAIYEGKADINACPSTSAEKKKKIGEIMGIIPNIEEKSYAIVHCCGGNACRDKYDYQGYGDCKSGELLSGGRKACYTGCMGLATCVDVCPNFAVEVNENGCSEINRKNCTSCGICITNCPKSIIKRIRETAKIYCACSNTNTGKDVKSICSNGCIGCGLCAKLCPQKAIEMVNNLPVFDYDKCSGCMVCVEKCPTKVIKEIKR